MRTNAAVIPMSLGPRGQYVYTPANLDYNMSGWLKTLWHKPLKALGQALPIAAAFIPGAGVFLTHALGATAAAAIASIGTSMAVSEAMQQMGSGAVQPLVSATLLANGTDPTQENVNAATKLLQQQLAANGLQSGPATTAGSMTVDEMIKKYWMFGAVGVGIVALILITRK